MEKIWLKNYPQGVSSEVDPGQYNTLNDVFSEACQKFAGKTAFENFGAQMSFTELDQQTNHMASFYQQMGLKKGDRIALQMPNLLQYPIALFGAQKAGLIVVNTNPLYTAREMKHQFQDAEVKAIVILANSAHLLEEILPETSIETVVVTQVGDLLGWPKSWLINFVLKHVKKMVPSFDLPKSYSFLDALNIGQNKPYTPVELHSEDIAFLQYTGGTTGVSKGAMLTHRNVIANMLQICEWMSPKLKEGEEIAITALPLYHIFSLTVNCLSFMRYGGKNLLVTNPRDISAFVRLLAKNKFTVFPGLNTLFNALMNHPDFARLDFSQLKMSVAGGMALQKAVARRWVEVTKTPIIEGYGLTETSPVACCNPTDGTDRVGTIGLPLPSTDIKVVGEDGQELPQGEVGELCIQGPQVMKGYWKREDETAKVLKDGWLHTGDIAKVDEDGFAQIVDRKKDMILVSGFNVYPNEIEDVLAHHQDIVEAAAIGIPDAHSGEVPKVFVVKTQKSSITESDIISYCKDNLVAYKVPKEVEFRPELPKTNVGKILRRALK